MNKSIKQSGKLVLTAGALAVLLAACGGGGGDSTPSTNTGSSGASNSSGTTGTTGSTGSTDSTGTTGTTATGNQFTQKATWKVTMPAAGLSVCYDFEGATEVAGCTGTAWDVKLTAPTGRGTPKLFTNSGVSGTGQGGVYAGKGTGLIDWADLLKWETGTKVPGEGQQPPSRIYFADAASGTFSGTNAIDSAAFEYGLGGATDHKLYPSYRVFLVTTDKASNSTAGTVASPVYALQVTGYYGGTSGTESGYPKFRWVNRSASGGEQVREVQLDAHNDKWVYFNLETGTEVASENGTWHIAFNRYRMRLNSTGTLGSAVGIVPAGLYEADGDAIASALIAATPDSTLSYLTSAAIPATVQWQADEAGSRLNPKAERESSGSFDYGWFKYYPTAALAQAAGLPATAHTLGADPSEGAMIRGGDGASFARFHLTKIDYADTASATSQQTWTFEFDVQPGAAK